MPNKPMITRLIQITLLPLFFALVLINGAEAHPPGLSSMDVTIHPKSLSIKVTFSIQDIEAFVPMDLDLDAEVTPAELEQVKPAIAALIGSEIEVSVDGNIASPQALGRVVFDNQNNAHVELLFGVHAEGSLTIDSLFLKMLADGHQQFVTLRKESGAVRAEKMLKKNDSSISINLSTGGKPKSSQVSMWSAFADFFKLGVEHILTGYDHLLFLFALLAVTHSFWPALKIITFFTIAHSITLALAGLDLLKVPSSLVEPLIAATIVFISLENIIRGEKVSGRHWLTFGFGLIHGFGFAGVLREMEISTGNSGILMPLFSFNLGIESGQVAVTAAVLPLIWWVNNTSPHAQRILNACSVFVGLMGCYWFLERTVFL